MTCSYCGTRNTDEHRCRRCGRRPDDSLTSDYALPHNTGALAAQPVLQSYAPEPDALTPRKPQPNLARAVQRSLFQDRSETKVVPIASYAPPSPRPRANPDSKPAPRPPSRRFRVPEEQASLDFLPPESSKPRTLGTTVEAMIYCEERAASAAHRTIAAILDWSMVLIGYGLFLTVFHYCVGEVLLDKTNLLAFGAVFPVLGFIYGLMWALSGAETPGMQWTRLRLTTFEGFPPERKERLIRFAGSCLSLCTVVGILWSLADEEGLAWQDHISRTFPTPRRADSQILFRR